MTSAKPFNLERRSSRSRMDGLCFRVRLRPCWLGIASGCWISSMLRRKAQHNGLLFEVNRELVLYSGHDRVAQTDEFGGRRVAEVNEGKGVPGGNRGAPHGEALVEAGLFHQPCGGKLYHSLPCSILRNLFGSVSGLDGYLGQR